MKCRGVFIPTPFSVFFWSINNTHINTLSLGGNGENRGDEAHRFWFFGKWKVRQFQKIKFSSKFRKFFLENWPCRFHEIFRICRGLGPRKRKSKNWGSDPQFGRGRGANFSIGPRSAPSGGGTVLSRLALFCSHISQWAPLKHLPALAQNPWKHFPQSLPNSASILKFRFFFALSAGAPLPQGGTISTICLVRFLEPRTMNKSCKFCAFSS